MCKLIKKNSLSLRKCLLFKGTKPFGQSPSSIPSLYIPTTEPLQAYLGGLISLDPSDYLRGSCSRVEYTAGLDPEEARSSSSSDNSCLNLGKSFKLSLYLFTCKLSTLQVIA